MNKREILKLLMESLEQYMSDGFIFGEIFFEEFKDLLHEASGHEREIFLLFSKQLNFIKVLGKDVDKADSNEVMKYQSRDYYSLHLQGKNFNIRLLMTFNEMNIPIFLAAFYERSGKKATNYSKTLGILEQRYSEIVEEK